MPLSWLPSLNAALNSTTAIFLVAGYLFIRQKNILAHKASMLAATFTSAAFLTSYLYYHAHHGATRFLGQGMIRAVYFSILISHTTLAIVQLPLIIAVLVLAFRNRLDRHRQLARITLPIWLYVSVTGVVVYWFLYQVQY